MTMMLKVMVTELHDDNGDEHTGVDDGDGDSDDCDDGDDDGNNINIQKARQ